MRFKNSIIGLFLLISTSASTQIIDNYGIRTGIGFANEYWDHTYGYENNLDTWQTTKNGLAFHIWGEKQFNSVFSLRPELGYTQKGCVYQTKNVNLHYLSIDGALKISPITSKRIKIKPYLIAGMRFDALLSKSCENVNIQWRIDKYNAVNVGGLLGFGIAYNDLGYLDFEYNQNITKTLDVRDLIVTDRYFALTVGVNIRQLVNPSKKKK